MPPASGSGPTARPAARAASICSGSPAVAPHISSESTASGDAGPPTAVVTPRPSPPVVAGLLGAAGLGLGHQALVLGVVDVDRLVDQHDRDVVDDLVDALQARVVEDVLVVEEEQRALVLGAGQELDQERVQRHRSFTLRWLNR